ncbi:MAG: rRNA maturation RNase YbeY [bacterium]
MKRTILLNFLGAKGLFKGEEKFIRSIVLQAALAALKIKKSIGTVSITITGDKEIKFYNKKYRHKSRPTDVLSFGQDDDRLLGDVLISIEIARKNNLPAGRQGKGELKYELSHLVIHGIMHLLGHDHGSRAEKLKMQKDEERALKKLKLCLQKY